MSQEIVNEGNSRCKHGYVSYFRDKDGMRWACDYSGCGREEMAENNIKFPSRAFIRNYDSAIYVRKARPDGSTNGELGPALRVKVEEISRTIESRLSES